MAGKTDEDNEILSLTYAWPNDYWFHVRGLPGSHVVLSHPESEEPTRELLERAAAIAAYHSKARNGGVVAVSYCRVKNVKRAHGASTGTVRISKEKVIKVRPAIPE
jgi:predicted ribosome quality control (RQC) complex YloA/Tae2 family protein